MSFFLYGSKVESLVTRNFEKVHFLQQVQPSARVRSVFMWSLVARFIEKVAQALSPASIIKYQRKEHILLKG